MKRTFYKVKSEYDGFRYRTKYYGKKVTRELVANELLTPFVFDRSSIPDYVVEKIRLETAETYYFFGARFEDI